MRETLQFGNNRGQSGGPPGGSLLGRLVATILGIGVFAVAIFLGAIFLAIVVGLVLIAGIVISVRVWWLKRKMEQHVRDHGDLEAEYVEIHEHVTVESRENARDTHDKRDLS